jgi:hypothetical protein
MNRVFLLWHTHLRADGTEDHKLVGVYESHENAQQAIDRVGGQPGFAEHLSGFHIDPYTVGVDSWPEGFVEVTQKQRCLRGTNRRIRRFRQARPVRGSRRAFLSSGSIQRSAKH